ncbi:MAG: PAS domain S-box protein, partial [Planctomycetaceae bacterium]|nr:PAS domain S-box protein [Planctomycetaceae bacterium]
MSLISPTVEAMHHQSSATSLNNPASGVSLRQMAELLQALQLQTERSRKISSASLTPMLQQLRQLLHDAAGELHATRENSNRLGEAQAEAIVRSAEMIVELEETRQQLSEARQEAEDAAQNAQLLSDTIFEGTSDAVLVMRQRQCIACNNNVLNLFGVTRAEVIGCWPTALIAGPGAGTTLRDGQAADLAIERALTDTSFHYEVQRKRKDGSELWIEVTLCTFEMNDQQHFLATVRDITERKNAELQIIRNRDFLTNVINTVPDQLVVTTAEGRLMLANNAFTAAHGMGVSADLYMSLDYDASTESDARSGNSHHSDSVELLSTATDSEVVELEDAN